MRVAWQRSLFLPTAPTGFTLVEVVVAMAIFVVAYTGIFLIYSQGMRMLDGLRQVSRAEDIAMANVEFLRTRNWHEMANLVNVTSSSSNLVDQIPYNPTNIVSTLTLLSSDPRKIGLKNASREIQIAPYPTASPDEPIRKATVLVIWQNIQQQTLTNSMSIYVTKGGMTADVF